MEQVHFSGKKVEQRQDSTLGSHAGVSAHPRIQGVWEGGPELSWAAWAPTEGTTEAPTRPQPAEPPGPAQGSSQLTGALRKENLASYLLGKGMHSPARISGCFDRKSPPWLWVPPSHHLLLLAAGKRVDGQGALLPRTVLQTFKLPDPPVLQPRAALPHPKSYPRKKGADGLLECHGRDLVSQAIRRLNHGVRGALWL